MNLGLPALDQLECGHRQKGASDVCGEGRTGKIVLLVSSSSVHLVLLIHNYVRSAERNF